MRMWHALSSHRMEIRLILKGGMGRMLILAMLFVFVPSIMVLIFSTYVAIGQVLTPRAVFTVLSLVNSLRWTALLLPFRALFLLLEGSIAVKRIKVGCSLT